MKETSKLLSIMFTVTAKFPRSNPQDEKNGGQREKKRR